MSDHRHDFAAGEWPFADPVDVDSFTTVQVMKGSPILFVSHDEEDGAWELLSGPTVADGDLRMACLGCAFERDRTVGELADLPLGWEAARTAVGARWIRKQSSPEEE